MNADEFVNFSVGKPWKNRAEGPEMFDCWGLVIDSFRKIDDLNIPEIQGYSDGTCSIGGSTSEQVDFGPWIESKPQEGSVMVVYEKGNAIHVGRVLCGGVLHAFGKNGQGSVKWNSFRAINSIFRQVKYYAYNNSC